MRNHRIDLLRFIGLVTIVFAHANPPETLFQLRNYDVPLMVLISGMSFGLAFKPQESYFQYVWKRIKRLVFPTWIFLTGYFSILFLVKPTSENLDPSKVFDTYCLIGGIGFVWIIRVFLLVALAAPFIYRIFQRRKSDTYYLIALLIAFAIYEAARPIMDPLLPGRFYREASAIVYYIIPYSLVFGLGLVVPKLSARRNSFLGGFFLLVFGAIAIHLWQAQDIFVGTQAFKYPPATYYLSYAVGISLFWWVISDVLWKVIEKLSILRSGVLFVAQNSMWIYLWHIPLVKASSETMPFFPKAVMLLVVASTITAIQSWLVHQILISRTQNIQLKKNLRSLLTG
ncbi:MAG: acyltransferase [Cyanobacteria bacterium J06643_4]